MSNISLVTRLILQGFLILYFKYKFVRGRIN